MEQNSGAHQYRPITSDGKDSPNFILPAEYNSPGVKAFFATEDLYCDLRDQLEVSIVKLFKVPLILTLKLA